MEGLNENEAQSSANDRDLSDESTLHWSDTQSQREETADETLNAKAFPDRPERPNLPDPTSHLMQTEILTREPATQKHRGFVNEKIHGSELAESSLKRPRDESNVSKSEIAEFSQTNIEVPIDSSEENNKNQPQNLQAPPSSVLTFKDPSAVSPEISTSQDNVSQSVSDEDGNSRNAKKPHIESQRFDWSPVESVSNNAQGNDPEVSSMTGAKPKQPSVKLCSVKKPSRPEKKLLTKYRQEVKAGDMNQSSDDKLPKNASPDWFTSASNTSRTELPQERTCERIPWIPPALPYTIRVRMCPNVDTEYDRFRRYVTYEYLYPQYSNYQKSSVMSEAEFINLIVSVSFLLFVLYHTLNIYISLFEWMRRA